MRIPPLLPRVSVPRHIEYPKIDPVPEGTQRPFWSVMIPTYNRSDYLEKTLRSVLDQNIGPDEMQIEVVDNCSTQSDPEQIVRSVGGDRVDFYRQPQNVGMSGNWTTCVKRARGHWVHILHDDDMVMPGFYEGYRQLIEAHPEVSLVFSRGIGIDEHDNWTQLMWPAPEYDEATGVGVLEDPIFELSTSGFILAPTAAVARRAYEQVGGFMTNLVYTVDWEMWMRVALTGPLGYIHMPRLLYRLHPGSDTERLTAQGRTILELLRVRLINIRHVPEEQRQQALAQAYARASRDANAFRSSLHLKGKHVSAIYYAIWAIRLNLSLGTVLRLGKSLLLVTKAKAQSLTGPQSAK